MEGSINLMDELLGFTDQSKPSSLPVDRVLLIEDCVQTSGAFVIHHIVKRTLCSPSSSGLVIFVALAHPFSHYERILRKLEITHISAFQLILDIESISICLFDMLVLYQSGVRKIVGCNLAMHRDRKRFLFFDMLLLKCSGLDAEGGNLCKGGLVELYGKIHKTLEILCSEQDTQRHITVIIDDFSLIEVAANGSSKHCTDFLHYFHTLTSEFNCSLVILNHEDIYDELERSTSLLQMEYIADTVIKVEPLSTGLAEYVHGQLTVDNKGTDNRQRSTASKLHNFHFRLKENGVECFYPGTQI